MPHDALHATAEARLVQLRQDLAHGRAQLAHLQEVLPRIEGAIQVLEELLTPPAPATPFPPTGDGLTDGAHVQEVVCPNPNTVVPTNLP